jgi:D-hexose-6-phosphate mutarotase
MSFKMLTITNAFATAKISLYGGQVLSYIPHGNEEVLWLNPQARFEQGKAIRGGIPICWPWFGPLEGRPSHGFARTMTWNLVSERDLEDGETEMVLRLTHSPVTEKYWPYFFILELTIEVGQSLRLSLKTMNEDHRPIRFTEALHSYFMVSDINHIQLEGLKGYSYLDQLGQGTTDQNEVVTIEEEIDRIYTHEGSVDIKDQVTGREIQVNKQNSQSTIVWNPWIEKSLKMGDVATDAFRNFVCVESGNVRNSPIRLEPGQNHSLSLEIWV